jgi:hypothetical protein
MDHTLVTVTLVILNRELQGRRLVRVNYDSPDHAWVERAVVRIDASLIEPVCDLAASPDV